MSESIEREKDRNARAYGFEVGRGAAITDKLEELSADNPFLFPNWRTLAGIDENEDSCQQSKSNSPLMNHAKRELKLIGEDPWTAQGALKMIQAFADMGHSGASAEFFIPMLVKLLQFETLTPITSDPDEWRYYDEDTWGRPGGIWQNKRNPKAFSEDAGQTYYLQGEDRLPKPFYRSAEPTKKKENS